MLVICSLLSSSLQESAPLEPSSASLKTDQLQAPSVLRIPLNQWEGEETWKNLDPFYLLKPWTIDDISYDTLVSYDPELQEIQPELAIDWFVSNNSKHWTFILRDDVFFHNGEKFTADSVKYTFERLYNPEHESYIGTGNTPRFDDITEKIKSIHIKSDYKITFNLKEPFSPFISWLVAAYILTPTAFEQGVITKIIGTGPYSLDTDVGQDTRTYSRNANYYKGLAPFETIVAEYIVGLGDAYIEGVIDTLGGDSLSSEFDNELEVTDLRIERFTAHFNFDNEYLSQINVRQALNMAHNRSIIVDGDEVIYHPIFFEGSQYLKDYPPTWEYNPELANQLLDDQGIFRDNTGTRFTLNACIYGSPFNNYYTDYYNLFEDVGVKIEQVSCPGFGSDANYTGIDIVGGVFSSYKALDPFERVPLTGNSIFGDASPGLNPINETIKDLFIEGITTPVRQEKEYYVSQLLSMLHKQARSVDLAAKRISHYFKLEVRDFVTLDYRGFYDFVFIDQTNTQLKLNELKLSREIYNGITTSYEISNSSIYFHKQDIVIGTLDQSNLNVNVMIDKTTNEISEVTENPNLFKYLKLDVGSQQIKYQLNVYYDLDFDEDKIYLWEWKKDSGWIEVKIQSADLNLNYVTTTGNGDKILALSITENLEVQNNPDMDETIDGISTFIVIFLTLSILILPPLFYLRSSRSVRFRENIRSNYRYLNLFTPSKKVLLIIFSSYLFIVLGITALFHLNGEF
jgi:ABC-type transport system substrate-binding protein